MVVSIWLIISSFGIFLGVTAKLGPLASVKCFETGLWIGF